MEKKEKDENNVVDNSKKTNTIKYVILLLVAVLSGFLVGFGVTQIDFKESNDKKEEKQEKDDGVKEDKVEVRDLIAVEKKILLEQIRVYNSYASHLYENGDFTSEQELLQFAYKQIKYSGYNTDSISEEQMLNMIKKYFYLSSDFKHQDIRHDENTNFYNYDDSNKTYIYNEEHLGHEFGVIPDSYVHFIDGKVTNEKEVVLKAKVLLAGYCGGPCGPQNYYASYSDAWNKINPLFDIPQNHWIEVDEELFKTVSDKVGVTVFTFIKDDDGNYGLKSVTFE